MSSCSLKFAVLVGLTFVVGIRPQKPQKNYEKTVVSTPVKFEVLTPSGSKVISKRPFSQSLQRFFFVPMYDPIENLFLEIFSWKKLKTHF